MPVTAWLATQHNILPWAYRGAANKVFMLDWILNKVWFEMGKAINVQQFWQNNIWAKPVF